MKVLVTGVGASPVAAAVAAQLTAAGATVVTTDLVGFGRDEDSNDPSALLEGVDEVVHQPFVGEGASHEDWLDAATRSTYELLLAASEAGVRRATLLSTMSQFLSYPANIAMAAGRQENWQHWAPKPTPHPASLAYHLAEFIGKQFARSGLLHVLVARVGSLHSAAHFATTAADAAADLVAELMDGTAFDDEREANAFFGPDPSRWQVLHLHEPVTSTSPNLPPPEEDDVRGGFSRYLNTSGGSGASDGGAQRVLLLGAKGFLGPHLMGALEEATDGQGRPAFEIIATDVARENAGSEPEDTAAWRERVLAGYDNASREVQPLDVTDPAQVAAAARSADVIVNCAVTRFDPTLCWRVNTYGTYNAVRCAAIQGHRRFLNTGPMFGIISPAAEDFDDAITEDSPCSPGLSLYAITKACGHVCTQVFAANTPGLKVLKVIFNGFFNVEDGPTDNMHGGGPGGDTPTMSIS